MQTKCTGMIFGNKRKNKGRYLKLSFKLILVVALLFSGRVLYAQDSLFRVIPEPVYAKSTGLKTFIHPETAIYYPESLTANAALLNEAIRSYTGYELPLRPQSDNTIAATISFGKSRTTVQQLILELDSVKVKEKSGYELTIQDNNIAIVGHDPAGVFYGIQSLIQLLSRSENNILSLPQGIIKDYPRFNYRGMHLDVGRHLYSVDFLKRFIDLLSLYKFNIFHWHLTEDQGWRIEIKKYPKLQSIAAWRSGTIIGHKKESPHTFDGKKYGGYYTQEQIKEVVAYAGSKYVNVLPEIEMPGHALASLTAYPELGCTGGPYQTAQFWGVFDDVFCAGNEQVYTFMEDVLDEVISLFPYAYIHIGGDECPKLKWEHCPKCQKRIKDEGLKDEHELQGYFMKRIERYLAGKNKKAIGWDEVLEGGISKSTTIMNWRGEQSGIAAAKAGYEVIMTPENLLYLDYYQSLNKNEPIAAGNYTPLSKVYAYEPVPDALSLEEAGYIKGIQAAVWTEYMSDEKHLEYMVFPRALAVSEIAWSERGRKNYPWFLKKLRQQEALLKNKKVNYFPYFDELTAESKNGVGQVGTLALKTTLPKALIRYTTDGSKPVASSKLYQQPILLNRSMVLNAQLFVGKNPTGRVFNQEFRYHLGSQKKITLLNPPAGKYAFPANLLLNGMEGHHRFNDGQWLGFSGKDLDAVVDLGKLISVSSIGINMLNYHWQRMWAPTRLRFLVSVDGTNFKEIYTGENFEKDGINKVQARFPAQQVRYVRVVGENVGTIPKGSYGEGEKAWLMADEIIIQ
ncbi:family 20 glycosylhydrolase [Pedobacter gandavensis]|uniref:glycoside hydrolase family 20 protein n=1 Tax=Pedobacter gandavensis TaxID=2679963 RepID=UPI002479F858|nr:family 20 glycosylhydrolase [Pedobacter gandavensis]WGQ08577.1 family 20 glycosylhydrolase [Pedobacter gandavensis]